MNRSSTTSGMPGKWWLPDSTEADAIEGTFQIEGQIPSITMTRPFSRLSKPITVLIGFLNGNQETMRFQVVPAGLNSWGANNSGSSLFIKYLVTGCEPVTK